MHMEEARPIRGRELLIDNGVRKDLRHVIDPQIDRALNSRGYTEDQRSSSRIYLDGTTVLPSKTFRDLYETPFHALTIAGTYDVHENERTLNRSTIELSRIGGFTSSQLVTVGERYYTKNLKVNQDNSRVPFVRISSQEMHDVLRDTRAHTSLGYRGSDTDATIPEIIAEIEDLRSTVFVDQRASYQLLTSPQHGDVQMNIGKSFEMHNTKAGNRIQRRRKNIKRLFEIIAKQPIENGDMTIGIRYHSGRSAPELKITAEINSEAFEEEQKQALYNEMIRSYQEPRDDIKKFANGILRNLDMISDQDSDIVRLG